MYTKDQLLRRGLEAIAPWKGKMPCFLDRLFAPIDIAALVYFRVVFGLLMVWELGRYVLHRHVDSLWIQPEFHFKYLGFGWVPALPGVWPYLLVVAVLLGAAGIAFGHHYRLSAAVFFFGFAWLFLIDQAKYMNHFYLICLLGFLSLWLPANRCLSLDAQRRPSIRSDLCPTWTLWLLRAQIAIVYFYGGVAKLNTDWLRGEPVRTWLGNRVDSMGAWMANEWVVYLICYGGLLFDLLIVPLLLWKRTRLFAFVLALGFHLTNSILFDIGVFPWLAIALTVLFFPASTPRQIAARLQTFWSARPASETIRFPNLSQPGFTWRRSVCTFLLVYLAWQSLMPLRHLLYPGNVSWTEEGHRFAWHMMLRSKQADALFVVRNPETGEAWAVDPLQWLTRRQLRKMAGRPDMLVQFAQHLAGQMRREGYPRVQVQAVVRVRLNGRAPALLIDPEVDLTKIRPGLRSADWIWPVDNTYPVPEWAKKLVQ